MSGWETYVRKVEPYVPGEQPKRKVIKLNTNENPYPPSPRVQKVLDGFDAEELRLYPDPEAADLIEAIDHRWCGRSDSNLPFIQTGA